MEVASRLFQRLHILSIFPADIKKKSRNGTQALETGIKIYSRIDKLDGAFLQIGCFMARWLDV
jgi:hypothetical protein